MSETMPILKNAESVLLFGGVFDPPHAGHVTLASLVRDEVMGAGAQLVFVPAAQSPHKPGGAIATDGQRLAMLDLATGDVANCSIWTDEIDRGGPSYWVETLERARKQLGEAASLRFLIGADQAIAFHRWRAFARVLSLAEPIVMLREPITNMAELTVGMRESNAWTDGELDRWASWVWRGGLIDASSSDLRDRAGSGADMTQLVDLDHRVRAYIEQNSIYSDGDSNRA